MARHSFFCIDGHTCGNPVRVVTGGSIPVLAGATYVRAAPAFPGRVRLDPPQPDVRAARPRHDVGRDPLSRDPAGLRRGPSCSSRPRAACRCAATARSARSPPSSSTAWSRRASRACSASTRRPAWSRPDTRWTAPLRAQRAADQRAVLPPRARLSSSRCRASARSRSTSPSAAISMRSSRSRSRAHADLADLQASQILALEPEAARRLQRPATPSCIPPTRRSTGLTHVLWAGRPQQPAQQCPQRRVLRRQGDRPLALRHRHLRPHGRSSTPPGASPSARISCTRASSAPPSPGRVEALTEVAGLRRHRALGRGLGPHHRPQHPLRRRSRPVLGRLPAGRPVGVGSSIGCRRHGRLTRGSRPRRLRPNADSSAVLAFFFSHARGSPGKASRLG